MWKHTPTDKNVRAGKGWTDENGIQHPANWHVWSVAEKTAAGLVEAIPDSPPDSRLYHWSQNADGTISSTAKNLDDVNEVDEDGVAILDNDGVQLITLGVKSNLKGGVKSQQGSLLTQTDWAVTRLSEKATAIPANIVTWRDAIRLKATEMEDAIDGAADTAAVEALFLVYTLNEDDTVTKTGVLFDWPELI